MGTTMTVQPAQVFNVRALGDHIQEMGRVGLTRVPKYIKTAVLEQMLSELSSMELQTADAETGPYRVKQDYTFQITFDENSMFRQVAAALSDQLNAAAGSKLSAPISYNDLVVQRYEPTALGISPHRDGIKYRDIVAIAILEGSGKFCLCSDRNGANPVPIKNRAGDVLLMEAPGFLGRARQPFHYVGEVFTRRTSFAMRQLTQPES